MNTKYNHKTIPMEALRSLPDGHAIVAWVNDGDDHWLREAVGKTVFTGHIWGESPSLLRDRWSESRHLKGFVFDPCLYAIRTDDPLYRKIMDQPREMPAVEWLKMLPKDIALRAVKNNTSGGVKLYDQLADALMGGFIWSDSPEGQRYWQNLHRSIRRGDSLPELHEPEPKEPKPLSVDKIREAVEAIEGADLVSVFAHFDKRELPVEINWIHRGTGATINTLGKDPGEAVANVRYVVEAHGKHTRFRAAEEETIRAITHAKNAADTVDAIQDGGIPNVRWEGPQ